MNRRLPLFAVLAAALLGLAACATGPKIRAQSAPGAQVDRFRTYGFFDKLGTDSGSYASVLSLNLKTAVARELDARGYRPAAESPDLLVNFNVTEKDKVQGYGGPSFSLGIGRGWGAWRTGYNWGVGINDVQIDTRTEGTLTIDVVDRARNEILWSGSAVGEITEKMLDDPRAHIDATVPKIFARFPGRAAP